MIKLSEGAKPQPPVSLEACLYGNEDRRDQVDKGILELCVGSVEIHGGEGVIETGRSSGRGVAEDEVVKSRAEGSNQGTRKVTTEGGRKVTTEGGRKVTTEGGRKVTTEGGRKVTTEGGRKAELMKQPKFASTDLRYREDKPIADENRSASEIIWELNKFSKQKPGGQLDLHNYSSVGYCKLCEKSCTCLIKCSGPPMLLKSSPVSKVQVRIMAGNSPIPGLGDGGEPSTTLTDIEISDYASIPNGKDNKLRDMFNGCGFETKSLLSSQATDDSRQTGAGSSHHSDTAKLSKARKPKKNDGQIFVDLEQEWKSKYTNTFQSIDKSSQPKFERKLKSSKVSSSMSPAVTSLYRKLSVSEQRCERKIQKKLNEGGREGVKDIDVGINVENSTFLNVVHSQVRIRTLVNSVK